MLRSDVWIRGSDAEPSAGPLRPGLRLRSRRARRLAAFWFFACALMALVPFGCASNVDYPALKHAPIGPHAPNPTIARMRECVEEYGPDMRGVSFVFHAKVSVNENGRAIAVETDVSHADLAGCTRAALRAMALPPELLLMWASNPLARGDGQTKAARGLVGNIVILGVSIALAPIVIEAAGVTIMFMILVAVGEDILDAARRRRTKKDECTDGYVECMDSKVGDQPGNTWNETRCARCLKICVDDPNKSWPSQVQMWEGWVPCGRLGPAWQN